jgi:hypothetical protein
MPWNDPISLTIITENWFSMQGFSNLPLFGTMTGELITYLLVYLSYKPIWSSSLFGVSSGSSWVACGECIISLHGFCGSSETIVR